MQKTIDSIKNPRGFIFDPSLVLYLPLYECDGNSFASRDAYGHLVTVIGASWRHDGRDFDGVDDSIALGAPWSKSLANINTYTIEAWARTNDYTQNQTIYGERRTSAGNAMLILVMEGSVFQFYHRDNANNLATCTWATPTNNWVHYAAVRKAANSFELYIDAVSVATSSTNVGASTLHRQDIGRILAPTPSYPWSGTIGEIRIYHRALTQAEIQQNYLATKWRYR